MRHAGDNNSAMLARRGVLTGIGASALMLSGCKTFDAANMDFGKLIEGVVNLAEGAGLGEQDELAMADKYYGPFVDQFGGAYKNRKLQASVERFCEPLFATSKRENFAWEIAVIDDDTVNAWAVPGGKLAINKGLLRYVADEHELAAVISHEIGHAEQSHTLEAIRSEKLGSGFANLAGGALAGVGGGEAADLLEQLQGPVLELVTQGYSREDEHKADAHILTVFAETGHDPAKASKFFHTMLELVPADSNGTSSLYSSHPGTKERIGRIDVAAASASRPTGAPNNPGFSTIRETFPLRSYFRRTGKV